MLSAGCPARAAVLKEGKSAALLGYGQTGSGKTFQIQGDPAKCERWGIVPFAVAELLARVADAAGSGRSYLITMSVVELYGEHLRDLLAAPGAPRAKLELRLNAEGSYNVVGALEAPITAAAQAIALLEAACQQARTGSHMMNASSSRSFVDFILKVESLGEGAPGGATSVARLHLVDLAGSERQARTGATGERLREAGTINSALLVLRRMVAARCERARRAAHAVPPGEVESRPPLVPYNESPLTRLLKDALSGDARLLVLACLSQAPADHDATLDTLGFTQACRSLTAAPKVRYVRGGQIAGVAQDLRGLAAAAAAAEGLAEHRARLAQALEDREKQLERQRIKVDYLETELAVERTLAQGRAAREANIALALQRSVAGLAATTCDLMRAYVAGGAGAEVVGSLLASSQLPQLQTVLEADALAAQLDAHALLRLLKAFLQVNYSRGGEFVRAARGVFALLRTARSAPAWADALPFCLAQLAGAVAGAAPLPAYVQDNVLNLLSGILKALDERTLAALQPNIALEAARDFLSVARGASAGAAAEPCARGAAAAATPDPNPVFKPSAKSEAARGGLVQRVVTVLNMLGARLQALDAPLAATPVFLDVAAGVRHFKLLAADEASGKAATPRTTRSGCAYSAAASSAGGVNSGRPGSATRTAGGARSGSNGSGCLPAQAAPNDPASTRMAAAHASSQRGSAPARACAPPAPSAAESASETAEGQRAEWASQSGLGQPGAGAGGLERDASPDMPALRTGNDAAAAWLTGGSPAAEADEWLEEQEALQSGRKPAATPRPPLPAGHAATPLSAQLAGRTPAAVPRPCWLGAAGESAPPSALHTGRTPAAAPGLSWLAQGAAAPLSALHVDCRPAAVLGRGWLAEEAATPLSALSRRPTRSILSPLQPVQASGSPAHSSAKILKGTGRAPHALPAACGKENSPAGPGPHKGLASVAQAGTPQEAAAPGSALRRSRFARDACDG